jgi:hypothetical protein
MGHGEFQLDRARYPAEQIRMSDLRAFFDVGFSSIDAAYIGAHVGVRRGSVPEVQSWP